MCGLRDSAGLGNSESERQPAALSAFCQKEKGDNFIQLSVSQRSQTEPRDTDEDETDSVQNLLLGDSGGGAELDKREPQHAQRGGK